MTAFPKYPPMVKKLTTRIRDFLRETVIGRVVISILSALLLGSSLFTISFLLERNGYDPLTVMGRRLLTRTTPYIPYAVTVLVTLALIALIYGIRTVRRRAKAAQMKMRTFESSEGFVGREPQINKFLSVLAGESKESVYAIHGISGSGKTWLVNQLLEQSQKLDALTVYVDFRRPIFSHISLMNEIAIQLGYEHFGLFKHSLTDFASLQKQFQAKFELLDKSLAAIIGEKDEEVVLSFIADLKTLSARRKVVVAFDTYERLTDQDLISWINRKLLLSIREKSVENVYLIIAGWDNLSLGADWSRFISSQKLTHLTRAEVKRYLELELGKGNFEEHLVTAVYDLTSKGHPLFVGLACNLLRQARDEGMGVSTDVLRERAVEFNEKAVAELLMDRILKGAPSQTADAIRLCAIPRWFDGTVLREALGTVDSQPVIDLLTGYRSFILPHRPYGYEYHEIVRDLLLSKWRNEDRGKYMTINEKLADYYRGILEGATERADRERAALEVIYHSATSQPDQAISLYRKYMDEAIGYHNLGFAEQLALQGKQSIKESGAALWLDFYDGQIAYMRGKWQETQRILLKLLQTEVSDTLLRALSANALGQIYYYQGEFDDAIKSYEESESLISKLQDGDDLAGELMENSAKAYRNIGQLSKAEDCHKRAFALAEKAQKEQKLATISVDMATTYVLQGKWQDAIESCSIGIATFSGAKNRRSLGRAMRNLAWAQMYAGHLAEATESSIKALELAKEVQDNYNIGIGYLNLGRIRQLSEDWTEGLVCFNSALEILRPLGAETDVGSVFEGIGSCTREREKWSEALGYYNRSLKIFRDIGYQYGLSLCLHNLGNRYIELGEHESALPLLRESEEVARKFQIHYWRGKALLGLLSIELHNSSLEEIAPSLISNIEELLHSYSFHDLSASYLFSIASHALRSNRRMDSKMAGRLYDAVCEGNQHNRRLAEKILEGIVRIVDELREAKRSTDANKLFVGVSDRLSKGGLQDLENYLKNISPMM